MITNNGGNVWIWVVGMGGEVDGEAGRSWGRRNHTQNTLHGKYFKLKKQKFSNSII